MNHYWREFWKGVASINMFPPPPRRFRSYSYREAMEKDYKALAEDWKKLIGDWKKPRE